MIIVGQSYKVTFQLSTDLSTAVLVQIGYRDPKRNIVLSPAIVDDVANGIVHYDVNSTTNVFMGNWRWWVETSFADGSKWIGETKNISVEPMGVVVH